MAQPKKVLARGLGNLISQGFSPSGKAAVSTVETASMIQSIKDQNPESSDSGLSAIGEFVEVPVALITPNPFQPRKSIDDQALQGLSESIREQGLLQPIVVRALGEGFELIAGERRFRAFQKLGLPKIPARLIQATDANSATIALIENLQREGLNPIEEALGYATLIGDFNLTQEKAAERLGKNRVTIANSLRLLRLPTDIQAHLATGIVSPGHAKIILGLEDSELQQVFARTLIEKGWSVRESEKQIKRFKSSNESSKKGASTSAKSRDADIEIAALEKRLATRLSARISLKHTPKKGQLVIHYSGLDDLQRILESIGVDSA